VLVLIATAIGASQEPSNTREASCMVRITADPSIVPLNPQTVNHLVQSSSVAGKAVRDVLGAEADSALDQNKGIRIEWLSQSIRSIGQPPAQARPRATGESMDEYEMEMMDMYRDPREDPMMESPAGMGYGEHAPPTRGRGGRRSSSSRERPDPNSSGRSDPNSMMMGGGYGMMGAGGMGGGMGGMGGGRGGMGGGMGGGMMGGGMGMGRMSGGMMGGGGMGGYGGMGGGMMGGGGMGGYGGMSGGMMGGGGMGGYGMTGGAMGGMYGGPAQAAPGGTQQAVTLRLSVHLPENVKPAAQEFLEAIVRNLERTLKYAYEVYEGHIAEALDYKEHQRNSAQERLEQAIGNRHERTIEGNRLEETLQTVVDLSILSPEMPFSEAIEHLKDAVEPPLPIVVMWKELLDSCEIEPTTPIDMDGLPTVKLETALRMLLAAVSSSPTDISYQIDDDVIVIREEEAQTPQAMPTGPGIETDVRNLAIQRRDLSRRQRQAEMYLTTSQARQRAIEDQIARIRHEAEIMMKEDSITRELQNLIQMSEDHLELLTRQMKEGRITSAELAGARENLVQAKISLARRREELAKSAGGGQLDEYNRELSRMAIDTAEKKAEIEILRRQLAVTEDKIARASMFDPKAARIRMAQEALNIAETQVTGLRTRLANLHPPTVTVIGAN
jgi:hypothetical protein